MSAPDSHVGIAADTADERRRTMTQECARTATLHYNSTFDAPNRPVERGPARAIARGRAHAVGSQQKTSSRVMALTISEKDGVYRATSMHKCCHAAVVNASNVTVADAQ